MDRQWSVFEVITGAGAAFLALLFICVSLEAGRIERELAERAAESLDGANLYWFALEPQGRKLVVAGAAPGATAADEVRARVEGLPGVQRVQVSLQHIGAGGACPQQIEAVLAEHPITFRAGHAELADASHASIATLAEVLRSCNERFEVAVHADPQGSAAVGLALSQRRADLVARRLVESGISTEAVVATGYGVSQPVAGAPMYGLRRAGPRVELRVLGGQT